MKDIIRVVSVAVHMLWDQCCSLRFTVDRIDVKNKCNKEKGTAKRKHGDGDEVPYSCCAGNFSEGL